MELVGGCWFSFNKLFFSNLTNIWPTALFLSISSKWNSSFKKDLEFLYFKYFDNSYSVELLGWVKSFAIFRYVLVCDAYSSWPKWKVSAVIVSTMVVGALTRCALLHFLFDLKASQMNVQYSLIWELMLCEFELSHNAAKTFVVRKMMQLITVEWQDDSRNVAQVAF